MKTYTFLLLFWVTISQAQTFSTADITQDLFIQSLEMDHEGNIWASSNEGLFRFDINEKEWIVFDDTDGIGCGLIYDLLTTSNNELLISHGPTCAHTTKLDPTNNTFEILEEDHFNLTLSLSEDANQNLWIGQQVMAINNYNVSKIASNGDIQFYDFSEAGPNNGSNKTSGIAPHPSDGSVWFSTRTGVFYIDASDSTHFYGAGPSTSIFFDNQENLWIGLGPYFGTTGDGILKITPDGNTTTIDVSHGLVNNRVHNFTEDQDGNIWVATEGGISKIELDGNIINFTENDGLAHHFVWDVLIDQNGAVWVATSKGVSTTADLTTSLENLKESSELVSIYPNPTNQWLNIQLSEGVVPLEVSLINSLGQKVYQDTQILPSNFTSIQLPKLSDGIYHIVVTTKGGLLKKKLSIQN